MNKADKRHRFVQMFQTFHKHVERRHGDEKVDATEYITNNHKSKTIKRWSIAFSNVLLPQGIRTQQFQNVRARAPIGGKLQHHRARSAQIAARASMRRRFIATQRKEYHVAVLKVDDAMPNGPQPKADFAILGPLGVLCSQNRRLTVLMQ
jgi:hypothetical protein